MFYASLFIDYFKDYLKRRLTYRTDFLIEIVSDLLFQGMNLIFILVVFLHTPLLGGWSQEQVVFIYGYFMVPYGIFSCFFNLWGFTERYIVKGEMDRILTRPAYNLWQIVLENLDPASLSGTVVGLFIMGYAGAQLDLSIAWYDPMMFVLFTAGAIMIYGGVYISLTSVSFFSDAPTGILPLMWNIQNYGRYPVNIYNKTIKFVLTFVTPFAFVGFYPAAYFLDREGWGWIALWTPVVGIVFLTIGLSLWNFGVKRYRGAGS
ncbi:MULTISPECIES: ABC transporter permease [Paenibacillus]|jgi:ABC-2 type transport system permease protein|uniref:ABC-2 family transporter protein n=1 Tax=Paenibacillus oceani TaxID=2772510 RepID=A0A927CDX7_9BACL|nr:ABC-2 family transporter protein [Paenibacillus oceani]MBD2865830.1 ABC-2 family transporter protein [Paenibacillus oceani]MDF2662292.1 transporter permease [Paenibacillus sp.]